MYDICFCNGVDNLVDAFHIRKEVFIDEQGFKQDDIDGRDETALHIIIYDGGVPAATGRLYRETDQTVWIGRISVRRQYRGSGVGRLVMQQLEVKARADGAEQIFLSAQHTAQGFYEKLGYETYGETYYDEHCLHIGMKKQL